MKTIRVGDGIIKMADELGITVQALMNLDLGQVIALRKAQRRSTIPAPSWVS